MKATSFTEPQFRLWLERAESHGASNTKTVNSSPTAEWNFPFEKPKGPPNFLTLEYITRRLVASQCDESKDAANFLERNRVIVTANKKRILKAAVADMNNFIFNSSVSLKRKVIPSQVAFLNTQSLRKFDDLFSSNSINDDFLGMYMRIDDRYILNSNLDGALLKRVLYHELTHGISNAAWSIKPDGNTLITSPIRCGISRFDPDAASEETKYQSLNEAVTELLSVYIQYRNEPEAFKQPFPPGKIMRFSSVTVLINLLKQALDKKFDNKAGKDKETNKAIQDILKKLFLAYVNGQGTPDEILQDLKLVLGEEKFEKYMKLEANPKKVMAFANELGNKNISKKIKKEEPVDISFLANVKV